MLQLDKWYSVKEVSAVLNCGVDTIRRLIQRGELKAIKLTVNSTKRKRRFITLRILGEAIAEFIRRRAA